MIRHGCIALIFVAIFISSLTHVVCVDDAYAQRQPNRNDEEQRPEPGERFLQNKDEQDLHQLMGNSDGFLQTFVNTLRSQSGVKLVALKLTEPMIGGMAVNLNTMLSSMLNNTYNSEGDFVDQMRRAGTPGKEAKYRKCVAKNTQEKNSLAAISICGGGNASSETNEGLNEGGNDPNNGPDPDDYREDEGDGGEGDKAKEELHTTRKLTDMIALRYRDQGEAGVFKQNFKLWYGDGTFRERKVGERVIHEGYEAKTACQMRSSRRGTCEARNSPVLSERESVYRAWMRKRKTGFTGQLFRQRIEVYRKLNFVMQDLCEYKKEQRGEVQGGEGAFRGYDNPKNFDFWSGVENEQIGAANGTRSYMVHHLSAGEMYRFDRRIGKLLFELYEIDNRGQGNNLSCETFRNLGAMGVDQAGNHLQDLFEKLETKGQIDEIDRFFALYAKHVGAMKTLNHIEEDIRKLYQVLVYEEDSTLLDLTLDLMNTEIGALEEVGLTSDVSRRGIGNKIVIANQHLLTEMEKYEKELKQYVDEGKGVRGSQILLTNTRRTHRE